MLFDVMTESGNDLVLTIIKNEIRVNVVGNNKNLMFFSECGYFF